MVKEMEKGVYRVCAQEKGQYRIFGPEGEQWAKVSGKFRYDTGTVSDYPAVGVRKAIQNGELSEERLLSYKKLEAENSYSEDSHSYLVSKEEKFKSISKINKANRKMR